MPHGENVRLRAFIEAELLVYESLREWMGGGVMISQEFLHKIDKYKFKQYFSVNLIKNLFI